MGNHASTIEVDRPISTVYNQWTQFESFPKFMEGVERVGQLDDVAASLGRRHRRRRTRV